MLVEVTNHCIDESSNRNFVNGPCPIEIALGELNGKTWVVDNTEAYFCSYGEIVSFQLPKIAKTFVTAYDLGKTVLPFEFELGGENGLSS